MRRTLIPARVVMQIQLMILLRVPPLPRLQDLCAYSLPFKPLLLRQLCDFGGLLFLLWGVVENGTSVLGACVHALAVFGRGVVHAVEELEEVGVGD